MGETSTEVLSILNHLMPGFLTAWVVYGLTTYSKPAQFERIVQALIYSFIVNAFVSFTKVILLALGRVVVLGVWDTQAALITSALTALILGLLLSFFMTNDCFFSFARRLKLTTRTPFPSEWYGAFVSQPRFIVLHLNGDRRILGYPSEWPSEPNIGHFRLTDAAWLDDKNNEISLKGNESILIPASQVQIVEFLKFNEEIPTNGSKASKSTTKPTNQSA